MTERERERDTQGERERESEGQFLMCVLSVERDFAGWWGKEVELRTLYPDALPAARLFVQ